MFETTGVYNEDVLREISKYEYNSRQKWSLITMVLALLVAGIFQIKFGYIKLGCLYLLAIILVFGLAYIVNRLSYKNNIMALYEEYNCTEVRYKTEFDDEGIIIHNLNAGSISRIRYCSFKKIVEKDKIFIILTKAQQTTYVFKDCLTKDEIEEFKLYIRERCPRIRLKAQQ
ncbi:MAG: YcxB family protein [Clostridium sp.]